MTIDPQSVALIVAMLAIIPGVYAIVAQRKLLQANAASAITESAIKLVEKHESTIAKLEVKIKYLEEDAKKQKKRMAELTRLIQAQREEIHGLEKEVIISNNGRKELEDKVKRLEGDC